MLVSHNNKTVKNFDKKQNLSQCLKFIGTAGLAVAGAEHLNRLVNKKASKLIAQDYIYGAVVGYIVAGTLSAGYNFIVPMWREITEYHPDKPPLFIASGYSSIIEDRADDLYS